MIGEQRMHAALSKYNQVFLERIPAPEAYEHQFS